MTPDTFDRLIARLTHEIEEYRWDQHHTSDYADEVFARGGELALQKAIAIIRHEFSDLQ